MKEENQEQQSQKIQSKLIKVSVDNLVNASWNYKKENKEMTQKLINNIRRNGQIETICVRELDNGKYEVVNGNHRLEAFKAIGLKEVFAFNLGKISINQAKRIAVELNETRFGTNLFKLSEVLKEIVGEYGIEDSMETLPINQKDIEEIISLNNPDEMIKKMSWELPQEVNTATEGANDSIYTRTVKIYEDDTFRLLVNSASQKLGIEPPTDIDKTDFFKLVLEKIIGE